MGIADRDYTRAGPGSTRSTGGLGSVRMWSVNTWLIVLCVAVFVLNNIVFRHVQAPMTQDRAVRADLPAEVIRAAEVDRRRGTMAADGTYHYPLVVRQQDDRGRVWQTDIGYERVRYMPVVAAFGHFSTGKFWSDGQIWRLISFQFLHANLSHLVLNMLGLFFFGGLVEQYLGGRRFAVLYLASGVCGALAYLFLNLLGYLSVQLGAPPMPLLLVSDPYVPLVGASAGVFGVMMAAAYIAPRAIVDVFLIIPMTLRTAVYIFLAIAVLNLYVGGNNAGGDAAHVGGAVAGAYLIRRPHLLRDMLTGFGLIRAGQASPSRRARRDRPVGAGDMAQVDALLGKISAHGIESLTDAERAVLRRAAGR